MPTYSVTWQQVAEAAGLRGDTAQTKAEDLLEAAIADLEEALVGAFRTMPDKVADRCVLSIAKAYADRSRTPGNATNTQLEDNVGRWAPRDPLHGIRPILARYTASIG